MWKVDQEVHLMAGRKLRSRAEAGRHPSSKSSRWKGQQVSLKKKGVSLVSVLKLDVSVSASLVRYCREAMPSAYYFAYRLDLRLNLLCGPGHFRLFRSCVSSWSKLVFGCGIMRT